MNENYIPLVTVGVYTYNSSKTVIETLESIKNQSYPKLELIVSDDCSTDETVSLCQEWIEMNRDRFVNTIIIVPEQNTGQSGNYNRALKASNGEWIKDIDGDDLLTPNCIEDYIVFVKDHPDAIFVFGKAEVFGPNHKRINDFEKLFDYEFFNLSVEEKHERLIKVGNCIPSASAFSNVKRRQSLDLWYDERIPYLEDWPMWVKATKRGYDLFFLNKIVCRYRVGGDGTTSGTKGESRKYKISLLKFELYYILDIEEELSVNVDHAINRIAERELSKTITLINKYESSYTYKIGKAIMYPLNWVRSVLLFNR